jgi:hypothetical protein
MYLFEHVKKKEIETLKYQALANGIEFKGSRDQKTTKKQSGNDLLFKDPKEYEHLSQEEKERLTKDMMQKFSPLAANFNASKKPKKVDNG